MVHIPLCLPCLRLQIEALGSFPVLISQSLGLNQKVFGEVGLGDGVFVLPIR